LKTRREFLQQSMATVVLAKGGVAMGLPSDKQQLPEGIALAPLGDESYWKFQRFLGDGEIRVEPGAGGDVVEMSSSTSQGMAAVLRSQQFSVEPGRQYKIVMEIKTVGLEAITARLTGAPYIFFWDTRLLPGSFQPTPGTLAPKDSDWHETSTEFTTPTNARKAEVRLAYAAYGGYTGGYQPISTGMATGKLLIRNVRIQAGEKVEPLPATIHVSDPTIQAGIDTVAECLHNAQLSGMFTVGDGYTISGNIVPDLSFGLFGVRRLAQLKYLNIMKRYWELLGSQFSAEGQTSQRVMEQVLFPLGVDEIFSYDGDLDFLARELPIADLSFDYVRKRADSNGLVRLVDYGKWRMGQGADWVDWYPTRMEGKTLNFHQWYVRALRRCAALHQEFGGKAAFASAERARQYRIHADQIEMSLRRMYWYEDHFVTNIDYGGQIADEKWLDDHVWAIQLGTATPEQAGKIWAWIDAEPFKHEGTPTRWASFAGPEHGDLTWFGRNGCGDILARYCSGNSKRGLELLERISEIFARDRNAYEAYDMFGNISFGTAGWGNYTEHAGGYVWAVIGGPLGVDFDSDEHAVATIAPRLPAEWTSASTELYLRGTKLKMDYSRAGRIGKLSLSASGGPQFVRVRQPGGTEEIVRAQTGFTRSWSWNVDQKSTPGAV
jgi:hypothetical protein